MEDDPANGMKPEVSPDIPPAVATNIPPEQVIVVPSHSLTPNAAADALDRPTADPVGIR